MSKKYWPRISLSFTKDFVLIYRLSVVGIFIVGCLFVKYSLEKEKGKIEERLLTVSEQVEKSISHNVDYLKYQFLYAAKQIKEKGDNPKINYIAEILASFVHGINNQVDLSIAWNAFSWVDRNNNMSADGAGGVMRNPVDVSQRDYLTITTKVPEKLVFGKPVRGALSGRLIIPIGMGIFSDRDVYMGTLVFGLDVEKVLDKISKVVSSKVFSFVVINEDLVAFSSDNFDREKLGFVMQKLPTPNKNKDFENGKIISRQGIISQGDGFVVLRVIKNSPLKVAVFYDKDKAYRQFMNLALQQLCFILLVLFTCIILFQKIHYRIVKPMSSLSQLALRISKKDFSYIIEKPKSKELLELYNILHSVRQVAKREQELLKRLEVTNADLFRANEAKAEFLAKSSHDIKNYIFGISGLSRLILDSKKKSEILQNEELQMVETIFDQSEELMRFVEDLLDTNQVDVGDFSLDKMQPCDVEFLIERIVLLNKSLAMRHNILVRTEIENNLPPLICDVRRMKQVVVNLITNAIKYSNPKTTVVVLAKYLKDKKQIYIEVADCGIGMSENEIHMVMSGKGKYIDKPDLIGIDSRGIGMPIVLRLVELHGGNIEIESKKGQGTRIKLYFNIKKDADSKLVNLKSESHNNIANHKSILLVEDNPTNIKITTRALFNAGYSVKSVENGQDALKILEEENFDLILMDGEMPLMNGYDAAKKIRQGKVFTKFKDYATIPIIALMSSSDKVTVNRALNSGMNAHLEKSVSRTKLLDMVEKWLK